MRASVSSALTSGRRHVPRSPATRGWGIGCRRRCLPGSVNTRALPSNRRLIKRLGYERTRDSVRTVVAKAVDEGEARLGRPGSLQTQ